MRVHEPDDDHILLAVAGCLAQAPFASVSMELVARRAGVSEEQARRVFENLHAAATAVLDHERASMRAAQEHVMREPVAPLEQLVRAFTVVGENLANDIVVRAGVRLAYESREYFPERRIDPFRTWHTFVASRLQHARDSGSVSRHIDLEATVVTVVAAGMGTRDLLAFHDAWAEAPRRMENVMRNIVSLIGTRDAEPPAFGRGGR